MCDVCYIATVQLGNPPRDFKILMDSGYEHSTVQEKPFWGKREVFFFFTFCILPQSLRFQSCSSFDWRFSFFHFLYRR